MKKDMHWTSESTQKNEEDSVIAKPFYSSINWNLVACSKQKVEGGKTNCTCKPREDAFASRTDDLCVNYACCIECEQKCEQKCDFAKACESKKIQGNNLKMLM